ncbi:MAG: DUF948 domain-containing protein [Actinomycetota bacterium]
MSAGDWALIVLAVFWAVLVVVLAVVSVNLFRVLASTRELIDGVRTETVPLLSNVRQTVTLTNRELDRVDRILVSAGNITHTVERLTALVDQFMTTPLIKAISFSYGTQKALRRFRGETP